MLAAAVRAPRRRLLHSAATLYYPSTEHVSSTPQPPPPLPSKHPAPKKRSHLTPSPRPAVSRRRQATPNLPPTFGQNQLLPVSNSTRALLESVVADFDAPIRYAFAYGSGVFEQDGYTPDEKGPMLDFMFAVTHPDHFHSINMHQHPSHYAMHARMFGSDFVTRVQAVKPGVWFNAFVKTKGVVSSWKLLESRDHDDEPYISTLLAPDRPLNTESSALTTSARTC